LLDIPVETSGMLTKSTPQHAPVSMTVISKEDIAVTPARNIADLIEIYVPGAIWLSHLNPRIGMRGIIADRNYKFLLLINGKNMNNKNSQGITLEIQNWDLNDIERLEIIRGPGSVTYGPGAIGGIINIITRQGSTAPGVKAGTAYDAAYQSYGGYSSYGYDGENMDAYGYFSFRKTGGVHDSRYYNILGSDGSHGFTGKEFHPGASVTDYMEDTLNDPQFKGHLDLTFFKEWRLWARFSNQGTPYTGGGGGTAAGGRENADFGSEVLPARAEEAKAIAVDLTNKHELSELLALDSRLGYKNEAYFQYILGNSSRKFDEGIYNYPTDRGNVHYALSEQELYLEELLHFRPFDNHEAALGASWSENWIRPTSWFHSAVSGDSAVAGMQNRTAVDGRYNQDVIGHGFTYGIYSLFGELNNRFHPLFNTVLSGRMDKAEYMSTYLFSPRAAIISELTPKQTLKLIAQQSVRMNTLIETYLDDYSNRKSNPETLQGLEVIHEWLPFEHYGLNTSGYLNKIDVIGWDGSKSVNLGALKVMGVEMEAKYQSDHVRAGISHAVTKELDWKRGSGITSQGISYSNYNTSPAAGLSLQDNGNDLANFPVQISKVYVTVEKLPLDFFCHTDAQFVWGYPGNRNGVEMYRDAYSASGRNNEAMNNLSGDLSKQNYGGFNLRWNISAGKHFLWGKQKFKVTLLGENLLGFKRYFYSSGDSQRYPDKITWAEEPASLGLRTDFEF